MRVRPLPHLNPPIDDFREYLGDVAQTAIIHATCAQDMVAVRNDDAMIYHLAEMIGAARLIRDVIKDMRSVHGTEGDNAE